MPKPNTKTNQSWPRTYHYAQAGKPSISNTLRAGSYEDLVAKFKAQAFDGVRFETPAQLMTYFAGRFESVRSDSYEHFVDDLESIGYWQPLRRSQLLDIVATDLMRPRRA